METTRHTKVLLDFNSIKVRLKRSDARKFFTSKLFQFHKGTIKTVSYNCLPYLRLNFNSIKVRLKQIEKFGAMYALSFQFHKGTIKTLWP